MNGVLTQLGVGGIFVILVIREVFGFLEKRNGSSDKIKAEARRITLEEAVVKLADACDQQTTMFREFHRDIAEMRKSNDATHLEIIDALKDLIKTIQ